MEITVKVENKTYSKDLEEELTINDSNLIQEFGNQAKSYSWWATMSSLAYHEVEKLTLELKTKEAELDAMLRNQAVAAGQKTTESAIKNQIVINPVYQEVAKDLLEAEKALKLLQAGERSFAQRKDMLISLGSMMRRECVEGTVYSEQYKQQIQGK